MKFKPKFMPYIVKI